MISRKNIVVAKLPNAGLGNKLFVWARAMSLAYINHLPLYVIGLNRIHIGPFLRKERVKRFYFGQFKRNSFSSYINYQKHILFKSNSIVEPEIKYHPTNKPTLFLFDKIPSWKNYFKSIHKRRELIKMEFKNILSEKVKKI